MAQKVKFVLNRKGVGELLKGEAMRSIIEARAARVASNAGKGYKAAKPHNTGQRVAVNVYAATDEARKDNLENNTLLKALR